MPRLRRGEQGEMGLRTAAKRWVAGALCHAAIGRAIRAVFGPRVPSLRFPDLRIDMDAPGVTPEVVASFFWGIYESAELRFVRRHLRSDLDVVEIGSSIGAVSSAIAKRQAGTRRLVCVEANPALLPALRRNLAANAAERRVDVLNLAIGYADDRVAFQQAAASTSGRTRAGVAEGGEVEVEARTLSALLADQGLGDDALVSDVEGAEAGFVFHDAAALSRCRQVIIELHDTELAGRRIGWRELRQALIDAHGFELVAERGPVCALART